MLVVLMVIVVMQAEEVYPHTEIWLRNPAILEGVDDLTKLSYMHEAAILHNLQVRYMINQVYTFTGPILIAVNPYQRLPIYNKQMIAQYCGQPLGILSQHHLQMTVSNQEF